MIWNSLRSLLNKSAFLRKWKLLSHIWLFVTPWTIQAMEYSRPEYWSGYPFPFPGDLPNPGIKPRSPTLQADSLPAEPQGTPKNTGVGNWPLLWWIFPTQESNQGLLHCRWILYQLSYQGSFFRKERCKLGTSDYGSGMHFFLVYIFWFVDFLRL